MPVTPAPPPATRCTAATSTRGRPGSRSPSTCRPRPATTPTTRWPGGEVGKVGVPVSHIGDMRALFADIPLSRDEHLDDDQRHRDVAARALPGGGRGAGPGGGRGPGRGGAGAGRHDPERHHQGVPLARDLRLRARAVAAAHHRHGRLHRRRDAAVEPDQHLQLPPAGGRRDAGAGDRLRDVHRDRRAGRRARLRPGAAGAVRRGRRPHLVLRQRRACASSRRCARCAPSSSSGTS